MNHEPRRLTRSEAEALATELTNIAMSRGAIATIVGVVGAPIDPLPTVISEEDMSQLWVRWDCTEVWARDALAQDIARRFGIPEKVVMAVQTLSGGGVKSGSGGGGGGKGGAGNQQATSPLKVVTAYAGGAAPGPPHPIPDFTDPDHPPVSSVPDGDGDDPGNERVDESLSAVVYAEPNEETVSLLLDMDADTMLALGRKLLDRAVDALTGREDPDGVVVHARVSTMRSR